VAGLLLGLPALYADGAVAQDAIGAARVLRLHGCDGHTGTRTPLSANVTLNGAAVQWSRGASLKMAIAHSGYREDQSAGLHLSGPAQALRTALSQNLCAALTDPAMIDVGIFEHGSDTWIILAAPFAAPSATSAYAVAEQVLQLVNAARGQSRQCGRSVMAAAPPLRLSEPLNQAALVHAQDMLRYHYFEHTGPDGSSPAQRIAATGYNYRIVGENIASGPETPQEVVQGWLASPGHCQNIMDARFEDTGIAYDASRSGEPSIYWVQEFAAAR
jgi:uncharacterized protein YkwD